MVFPIGGAPDGNNAIGWSNAKDLYNAVKGNESRFIELWSGSPDPKEKVGDSYSASEIYGFLKSMDTDGKPGLSVEEYKVGLTEKKEDLAIKVNNDWQQFSNYMDLEEFLKLSNTEQMQNVAEWMLDLGLVTDKNESIIEAAVWIANWNHDNEKLAAMELKLAEIAKQENADTTNQGTVGKQDPNEVNPPPASGGFKIAFTNQKMFNEKFSRVASQVSEVSVEYNSYQKKVDDVKKEIEASKNATMEKDATEFWFSPD